MKAHKTSWFIASGLSLFGFLVIAFFVAFNEAALKTIDQPISQFIRGTLTPSKTTFFSTMTVFGNTTTIVVLTLIGIIALYKWQGRMTAAWLFINAALVQGAGNLLLKALFNRPRPSLDHLVYASNTSFPSGHSMGSMLFYGTLIFLLPTIIHQRTLRIIIQCILACIILLVGTSRVYLGVHYPTDVLGGFFIGFAWLCFSYPIMLSLQTKSQLGGN